MRVLAFTIVASLMAGGVVLAQQQARYRYLSEAVDRMIAAVDETADPTPASLEALATTGCNALGRLLEDPSFKTDLDKLAKMPRAAQDRAELKRDLALFVSTFMRAERGALEDAGLSPKSAESLLWAAASMRMTADRDLTTGDVLDAVRSLRTELCTASREIASLRTSEERRRKLGTWAMRVGGVLIIAANGAFASPTGGVALASAGIGSGVMGISFTR